MKNTKVISKEQKDIRKMVVDSYDDIQKGKGRDYKEFFSELENRYSKMKIK